MAAPTELRLLPLYSKVRLFLKSIHRSLYTDIFGCHKSDIVNFVDLTDVTLVDEDTNSKPMNRVILGNAILGNALVLRCSCVFVFG